MLGGCSQPRDHEYPRCTVWWVGGALGGGGVSPPLITHPHQLMLHPGEVELAALRLPAIKHASGVQWEEAAGSAFSWGHTAAPCDMEEGEHGCQEPRLAPLCDTLLKE